MAKPNFEAFVNDFLLFKGTIEERREFAYRNIPKEYLSILIAIENTFKTNKPNYPPIPNNRNE